ncbi:MAG: UvrB/UvrC motif-containing protein, partial [Fibrobacteria bacterium]|nr:UvrB/UvrC motif-containing protein [Fibrobacteria bacterium]
EAAGLSVLYMHSGTKTLERTAIINQLREGSIDILVGVNLLREGLDLPEVSLIVILDADKEGFLRNKRSMIQIAGRAARNINGKVIMYADKMTKSMQATIDELERRRCIQREYNHKYNINPKSIAKEIRNTMQLAPEAEKLANEKEISVEQNTLLLDADIQILEKKMLEAADNLDFEKAAVLRDKIKMLEVSK